MQRVKRIIQTAVLASVSFFLVVGYPLSALAEATPAPKPAASTTQSTAVDPGNSYNATTERWDTSKWHYNAATGTYEPVVAPAPTPTSVTPPTTPTASDTAPTSSAAQSGQATATDSTAPTTTAKTDSSSSTNTTTNAGATNGVVSESQTGDATVSSNTTAGNATSGNASASALQTNIINSAVSAGAQTPASFVSNIVGDVYGDIMLYPAMLAAMLQSAVAPATPAPTSVKSSDTNQVVNDITLHSASGNATVNGNTTAGNATSGSANAMAGVMNVINSMVAANKSFVGTINIYGNLNGDILVSPDFIPKLLASNAATADGSAALTSANTTGIINNVTLQAGSGSATVAGNTAAGSAKSGTATTNTVILNLTGQQIVASNSLLVFVNVLGTWIGMIVNAPAGTTAAALGSGVTSDVVAPQAVSHQTNTQLTNNINLSANTGNATVSNNTTAGNATSGNATASAAILNIANSTLGLSNWFGKLFINVFGSWEGSFGIDTANGNNPLRPVNTPAQSGVSAPQAAQFIARTAATQRRSVQLLPSNVVAESAPVSQHTAVLAAAATHSVQKKAVIVSQHGNYGIPSALVLAFAGLGLGLAGLGWLFVAARRH